MISASIREPQARNRCTRARHRYHVRAPHAKSAAPGTTSAPPLGLVPGCDAQQAGDTIAEAAFIQAAGYLSHRDRPPLPPLGHVAMRLMRGADRRPRALQRPRRRRSRPMTLLSLRWRYRSALAVRVCAGWSPVSPTAVLARFACEDEVVVQPDLLIYVKTIGHLPHFTLPSLAPGLHFTAFSGTG